MTVISLGRSRFRATSGPAPGYPPGVSRGDQEPESPAVASLRRAVRAAPDDAELRVLLAERLLAEGRLGEAVVECGAVLARTRARRGPGADRPGAGRAGAGRAPAAPAAPATRRGRPGSTGGLRSRTR